MTENKLRIKLEVKPDPYAAVPTTSSYPLYMDAWGAFSILLLTPTETITLLEWEWNIDRLAEWFIEHQSLLCCATLQSEPGESIPEADARVMYRDDSEFANDGEWYDWHEMSREYFNGHYLRSALAGARIPPIWLGCNHGAGEIALSMREGDDQDGLFWDPQYNIEWAYSFDMADFCRQLRKDLVSFLTEWVAISTHPDAIVRGRKLIEDLQALEDPEDCCTGEGVMYGIREDVN